LPLEMMTFGVVTRGKQLFRAHESNRAVRDGGWKAVKRLGDPWQCPRRSGM